MLAIAARILGYAALAAAMVIGVLDGARSIADGALQASSLGESLESVLPKVFAALAAAVPRLIHPLAWDPLLRWLLSTPAVPAFFAIGLALLLAGRRGQAAILPPE